MIKQISRSNGEKTFNLSINGAQRTYTNDKEGKRQAILDGLNAIETITVDEDSYLPNEAALHVVAAVMYPGGMQSKEAYQTVCNVAHKACAHLGYGDETNLEPPLVPFTKRGQYRKKYPPLDKQLVIAALNDADASRDRPQKRVAARIVWNQAAWEIYNRSLNALSPEEQKQVATQVDTIAQSAGWQIETVQAAIYYVQPLLPDIEKARQAMTAVIVEAEGAPINRSRLVFHAQTAAYGHRFYEQELVSELEVCLQQLMAKAGYVTQPENGEYQPLPVTLSDNAEEQLRQLLHSIPQRQTQAGTALLFHDMKHALQETFDLPTLSDWQTEKLFTADMMGKVLQQSGYQSELHWLQPYQFVPPLEDAAEQRVILKEVRVKNDCSKKLSLAKGLPVYTPAVVLDSNHNNVIYLEMVGNKQAVRANWAALVGKKVCWVGGQRIDLDGMKEHVMVRSSLPCGWVDHILIHKQASIREMNPEAPFFLLDDGRESIPSLFYPMLNKCLAMPVLEDWAMYLWENGRARNLVTLLNDGEGQGYAAWQVLPAPDEWQKIIQDGLRRHSIRF